MSRDKYDRVMIFFSMARNVYTDFITAVVIVLHAYQIPLEQRRLLTASLFTKAKEKTSEASKNYFSEPIFLDLYPLPSQVCRLFCAVVQFSCDPILAFKYGKKYEKLKSCEQFK